MSERDLVLEIAKRWHRGAHFRRWSSGSGHESGLGEGKWIAREVYARNCPNLKHALPLGRGNRKMELS